MKAVRPRLQDKSFRQLKLHRLARRMNACASPNRACARVRGDIDVNAVPDLRPPPCPQARDRCSDLRTVLQRTPAWQRNAYSTTSDSERVVRLPGRRVVWSNRQVSKLLKKESRVLAASVWEKTQCFEAGIQGVGAPKTCPPAMAGTRQLRRTKIEIATLDSERSGPKQFHRTKSPRACHRRCDHDRCAPKVFFARRPTA
jgi:hypothetical protein